MTLELGTVSPGSASPQLISVTDIKPHPLNDKLYKPVDLIDPEVQSLAKSIRQDGSPPRTRSPRFRNQHDRDRA